MGFPTGYTEVLLPKLLLTTLSLLSLFRLLLRSLGLTIDPDSSSTSPSGPTARPDPSPAQSLSASLIRDMLPAARFSDLGPARPEEGSGCAVCLSEFVDEDVVRAMRNCGHVFHRACVDRWIDHDRKTCPLCRTCLVPEELQEDFNEKLWLASGIPDFYSEYSPITNF